MADLYDWLEGIKETELKTSDSFSRIGTLIQRFRENLTHEEEKSLADALATEEGKKRRAMPGTMWKRGEEAKRSLLPSISVERPKEEIRLPIPTIPGVKGKIGDILEAVVGVPPHKEVMKAILTGRSTKLLYEKAGLEMAVGTILGYGALKGIGLLGKAALSLTPWAKNVSEFVANKLYFNFDLKKFPMFREEVRELIEMPKILQRQTVEEVADITGKLGKKQYRTFRQIVINEDLMKTVEQGKNIPIEKELLIKYVSSNPTLSPAVKGLTLAGKNLNANKEIVKTQLETAYRQADDTVLTAAGEHQLFTGKYKKILQDRGIMPEGVEIDNDWYFPHKVQDYLDYFGDWTWLPKKIRKPFRGYSLERKGSTKAISERYDDIMINHAFQINLHNGLDDFIVKTAKKYDLLGGVAPAIKKTLIPRRIYKAEEIGLTNLDPEVRLHSWSPENLTRNIFRANVIGNKTMNSLLEEVIEPLGLGLEEIGGMSLKELLGESIKQLPAIGKYKRFYLLPEEIATKLDRFRKPGISSTGWYQTISSMNRMWKRLVLDTALLPYQASNLAGDLLNMYREDIGAFTKLPEAAKILLSKDPKYKALLEEVEFSGVLQKGMWEEVSRKTPFMPAIGHGRLDKAGRVLLSPITFIESFSAFREGIPRLAKYLKDVERITAGKPIITKTVDIAGLEPKTAAAKVAREIFVDYGALPEGVKAMRDLMFPFASWYFYNSANWAKYVASHPGEFTVKIMAPYIATSTWNNTLFPDIERNLSPWRRFLWHLNTGWKTKDEKDIIIQMQTPVDMALKVFGLDGFLARIQQIKDGTLTLTEATQEQVNALGWAIPKTAFQLSQPIIQAFAGLLRGKDLISKRSTADPEMIGTKIWFEQAADYLGEKLFAPYMQYQLAQYDKEKGLSGWPRALNPFRAIGIYTVDMEEERKRRVAEIFGKKEVEYKERMLRAEKELVEGKIPKNLVGEEVQLIEKRIGFLSDLAKKITREAKTPEEKERAQIIKRKVDDIRLKQLYEALPKSIRPAVEEEIKRKKIYE